MNSGYYLPPPYIEYDNHSVFFSLDIESSAIKSAQIIYFNLEKCLDGRKF